MQAALSNSTPRNPPPFDYVGDRLMPLRDVLATVGAPRSTVYRWIKANQFPKPIQIGPRRVAWRATAIKAWIDKRETLH